MIILLLNPELKKVHKMHQLVKKKQISKKVDILSIMILNKNKIKMIKID